MSLLVSRSFVIAQLRIGLLSAEDRPSERIVQLPRPFTTRRLPTSGGVDFDLTDLSASQPLSPPIQLPAAWDARTRLNAIGYASETQQQQQQQQPPTASFPPTSAAQEAAAPPHSTSEQHEQANGITTKPLKDGDDAAGGARSMLGGGGHSLISKSFRADAEDLEAVEEGYKDDTDSGTLLQEQLFAKTQPHAADSKPQVSGLSALFGGSGSGGQPNENPFAANFGHVAGQGDINPLPLKIHFAFVPDMTSTMSIVVRRDATVEQVAGYALYLYTEEKLQPELRPGQFDTTNWQMRIVEDDGTVDDDFPALDRSRQIHQFQFDQFALCEIVKGGTGDPAPKNHQRSASSAELSTDISAGSSVVAGPGSSRDGSPYKTPGTTIPAKQQQVLRPKFFIKVHLYSTIEIRHSTTLNVSTNTSLREIFDAVCKKRSVNPRDYVLKLSDMKTEIAHDKTVGELNGETELFLVKRTYGASAGDLFLRPPGEELRMPAHIPTYALSSSDFSTATAYKKYTVVRKLPMFVGRHERVLTIDGEYIHLLPPENRHFFDTIKTSSYHVSSVVSCKQNKKLSTNFRLLVNKDTHEAKSYDFEASSAAEAAEICSKITTLLQLNN
ncbi:Component of a membrane-bound complex containing the Tor2p kinase [Sorochytrium milnesiophthora]